MIKKYTIKRIDTNCYWTGEYWGIPWDLNIKNAQLFNDEKELENYIFNFEAVHDFKSPFEEVEAIELVTVFVK